MNSVYTPAAALVNTPGIPGIKPRLLPLYRLIVRLSLKQGYAYPCSRWLAAEFGRDVATIRRWLAELRAAGWVRTEEVPGVERRIYPLMTITPPPQTVRRRAAGRSWGARGTQRNLRAPLPSSPLLTGLKNDHNTSREALVEAADVVAGEAVPKPLPLPPSRSAGAGAEIVAALRAQGVSEKVAGRLVQEHEPAEIADQLEALPHRKAENPAGALVAAIRERWSLPAALQRARDRARDDARRREETAARRALDAKRAQERAALAAALDDLPAARRAAIEAEALAFLERERAAAWRMARGKSCAAMILRGVCLELLAGRGAGACPTI